MTTIDKIEIEKFSKLAKDWWNPNGKFKPLHLFNPSRIKFIKEKLISHFNIDSNKAKPLAGLKILDIGCGGGLLCEPLNRLGATIIGIDVITPSKSDKWDTPQFQYRKYGWWSQEDFMPGMYVKELYLDKVEFAGMIANGRVFRGDKGRYVTFLTLGVGNGQYIDVTIKRAFAYSDHDVVWGQGTIRHSNNSDYVECFDSKGFRLERFSEA